MKKITNTILIICILAFILNLNFIQAVGSLLTPKMIIRTNIDSSAGASINRTIGVLNDGNYSINVKLEPSESIVNMVEVDETEFSLNPGEEKWVNFSLNITKAGKYYGEIIAVFSAENEQAIGLASQILIFAESDKNNSLETTQSLEDNNESEYNAYPLIILFLLIAIVIFLFFYSRKFLKQKKKRLKHKKKSDRSL